MAKLLFNAAFQIALKSHCCSTNIAQALKQCIYAKNVGTEGCYNMLQVSLLCRLIGTSNTAFKGSVKQILLSMQLDSDNHKL